MFLITYSCDYTDTLSFFLWFQRLYRNLFNCNPGLVENFLFHIFEIIFQILMRFYQFFFTLNIRNKWENVSNVFLLNVAFYENLSKSFKSDMLEKWENVSHVFILIFLLIFAKDLRIFFYSNMVNKWEKLSCIFLKFLLIFIKLYQSFFPLTLEIYDKICQTNFS